MLNLFAKALFAIVRSMHPMCRRIPSPEISWAKQLKVIHSNSHSLLVICHLDITSHVIFHCSFFMVNVSLNFLSPFCSWLWIKTFSLLGYSYAVQVLTQKVTNIFTLSCLSQLNSKTNVHFFCLSSVFNGNIAQGEVSGRRRFVLNRSLIFLLCT